MGHKSAKHRKKRYFCVSYHIKKDKKFDEFVTLSKKKIGPGKMQEYTVVLDLVNKEVLKNELPGIPLDKQVDAFSIVSTALSFFSFLFVFVFSTTFD